MTEAEKLLQETKSAVVAETQMEDICVIDSNMRIIDIPEQFKVLGVENDKDVKVMQFRMPKVYKGTDLSAFNISVNYQNARGTKDRYIVTDKKVSGDQIEFSWTVGKTATVYRGDTRFIVCMRLTGSDGIIQKEFNTTLATMTVLEGLEVDNPVIEQEEKDIIAQLLQVVDDKSKEAVQAVTAEGTKQTGNVSAEGTKQVKAVQDKGTEVLQSIPEDFTTQMETKLNKQQGIENKGKALVIGEDGNVVPGEVASGGGDGIAIINTMSGESPLVISDSAERVNKRLELGGKTEQVSTRGVNLFDEKLLLDFDSENYDKTQSGSGLYYYKFPVSGTVTVSTKNANKNGEYLTVGIKPDGSDKTWLSRGTAAISKYKTLTPEDGNIYLGVNNNLERVKSMIQNTGGIIINEGSAAQPYEPYTGNKPSPSPEYPQEIKSVGKWNGETQKYEVDVQVCNSGYLQKGLYADKIRAFPLEKGKTYRIRVNRNSAVVNAFILNEEKAFKNSAELYTTCNHAGLTNVNDTGIVEGKCKIPQLLYSGYTFTVTVGGLFLYQGVNNSRLNTDDAYVVYDFIKTVNENQPYVEQTLTITSDHPITKWDRLVEQGGQIGWLYKSKIDALPKTGYQYIETGYFSKGNVFTDSALNSAVTPGSQFFTCFSLANPSFKKGDIAWLYVNKPGTTDLRVRFADESINTIELFEKYMADKDIKILYETAQTEFVPLPQSEQNAIRALKTYYPTTVITVDGGEVDPDIKVTYTADTKNYIDGKVSAKVASILRQYQADTANLLSLMPMETQATMIENDTNNILNNLESEEAHE